MICLLLARRRAQACPIPPAPMTTRTLRGIDAMIFGFVAVV